MAKRQKVKRFSVQSYDAAHYRQTEQYTQAVDALFDRATNEIVRAAAKGQYDPDKPFSFDDYPSVKAIMQSATKQLASRITTVIESGSKKQWLFACSKNDGFISSILETSKLSKVRLKKMQDQNLDALKIFQGRKVEGMNLSQRVWKYVGQYREQLEAAIDAGLGEGRSAAQLSRDVRQNLRDPNRLFRRVRDKRGNLVLSKAARAFHPGRGVYRSSAKNAARLTRSEINMAYRESDYLRWQSLDFVVGFEVKRSNHEPLCDCDICEKLQGRYPKHFKFKGWHPQCMCYAVPILTDFYSQEASDDRVNEMRAALYGTEYKKYVPKETVTDVPENFKQWVKDHMEAQANWSSTPYFIKDNFKDGKLSKGLKFDTQKEIDPVQRQLDALMPQIAQARMLAKKWGLTDQLSMLETYVTNKDITRIQSRIATIQLKAAEMQTAESDIRAKCSEWGLSTFVLDTAMKVPDYNAITRAIDILKERVEKAKEEYEAFIHDANEAIKEARKYKIDIDDMLELVATITGDKREWVLTKASCKKALQDFLDKIASAKGTTPTSKQMPDELRAKSTYLEGEDYTFDKDFFDLIDPKKPIRLEILNSDSGSYSSYIGDLVHIAGMKRGKASAWERKSVIYHEYGHCIDAQRDLWRDPKLISLRNDQIKRLKKKKTYTVYERKWNHEDGGWYYERVKKEMSLVAYIDKKMEDLISKIYRMNDTTFTKRGITKHDVLEQIGCVRDTIKSLVVKYGFGHSTAYFKRERMKETEYLAHAFENAFIGNRVFQKYLPDIYNEMIAYVRALKPIK